MMQGVVVAIAVVVAAVYMALEVGPTRWRGRLAARLGQVSRRPSTRPWMRWIATRLGKSLSPQIGCGGCKGH